MSVRSESQDIIAHDSTGWVLLLGKEALHGVEWECWETRKPKEPQVMLGV